MFRGAELLLDAVPEEVVRAALKSDLLVGQLNMTDDNG
jgi:hypothetical protein